MSDYYDCRINAYSSLQQQDESISFYVNEAQLPITIVVIDLDLNDCDNSKEKLEVRLQATLKKIRDSIGGCPTVLDTGNGFHVYQPICGIVLNDINRLRDYVSFGNIIYRINS